LRRAAIAPEDGALGADAFSQRIASFARVQHPPAALLQARGAFLDRIAAAVNAVPGWAAAGARLVPFGSTRAGTALATSDVDLGLTFQRPVAVGQSVFSAEDMAEHEGALAGPERLAAMTLMRTLSNQLQQTGGVRVVTALRARVPVIKVPACSSHATRS
jgi:DNA polymerase sigma